MLLHSFFLTVAKAQQDGHLYSVVKGAVAQTLHITGPRLCLEGQGFLVSL